MRTSPVTKMSELERRARRVRRAIEARRTLLSASPEREDRPEPGGRAWINGFEIGGTEPRHLPLAVQFD